ncbi:hypothetical protein AF332_01625 [Sporosarcina globispora]|uniref:Transposase n=1 Tax=Sporosarcina globispora TaxID=1459 RepID=A0A0M0G800_SPOGL|nr:helix-turn-helix domain-containing protein [Sporosarcina globispora]KON85667.1 hypothetical protein AF332_01625 [Sporosarcina globispora]
MFKKRNQMIEEAKGTIPYWVIAERLGVHENTIQNWMKREMSEERKDKVMRAINEIKKEIKRKGDM